MQLSEMAEEPQSSEVALWESRAPTGHMTIIQLSHDHHMVSTTCIVIFSEKSSRTGCREEGEKQ